MTFGVVVQEKSLQEQAMEHAMSSQTKIGGLHCEMVALWLSLFTKTNWFVSLHTYCAASM